MTGIRGLNLDCRLSNGFLVGELYIIQGKIETKD